MSLSEITRWLRNSECTFDIPRPDNCSTIPLLYMQVRKNFFSTTRENRLIHYSVDTESVETVKSRVLNLSEAIEKIKVSEAIASLDKEIPKQKLLDTCFKNLLKSYLYLEFLSTIHSSEHQGLLENCSESVIMHDYNIPTLTRMYEQVDSISLKDMDCNVTQLFFSLRERLMGKNMKIYKISEAGVEAYQQSHLQSTLTKRKIQKQRKSYSERHEKLKSITDRLNDPDYLLYLSKNLIIEADSSDSRKYEELDFKYQEHKSIKAMDELLADECKQKSKQKQLPPLVSSSKKSRKKKGHLSRDTQRPIKTADRKESMPQTSNFQLSEKEINPSPCLIKQKTIKVHPRVRRWANVDQDSIKNIRDWSYESNQFVYNYSNHENPEFLIATHDLSNISRVLESNRLVAV